MLLLSLSNMLIAYERSEVLLEIAIKHDAQHHDIKPHLYLLWLDSLIAAVSDSDPLFDNKIEKAWRIVMQKGIDYMIGQYQ